MRRFRALRHAAERWPYFNRSVEAGYANHIFPTFCDDGGWSRGAYIEAPTVDTPCRMQLLLGSTARHKESSAFSTHGAALGLRVCSAVCDMWPEMRKMTPLPSEDAPLEAALPPLLRHSIFLSLSGCGKSDACGTSNCAQSLLLLLTNEALALPHTARFPAALTGQYPLSCPETS